MKLNQEPTFSEIVKQEICNADDLTIDESTYLVLTCLKNIAEYSLLDDSYELFTPYSFLVKFIKKTLENASEEYQSEVMVGINNQTQMVNSKKYLVKITPKNPEKLFEALNFKDLFIRKKKSNFDKIRGILMGAFLSSGSVNNPLKGRYHLEIRTSSLEFKNMLIKTFEYFQIEPKILDKQGKWVVYLKKGREVSDVLKLLHAHEAMFMLEDNRIERDLVNNMQRLVNLEVCNIQKISKANVQQVSMCKVINSSIHFSGLKPREQLYCQVRVKYPDANMNEICAIMNQSLPTDKPITKGSLSHIVKKIKEIYKLV